MADLVAPAPDQSAVLEQLVRQFTPRGASSGSLSEILETNANLLDDLDAFPALQPSVAEQNIRLRQAIEAERQREAAWYGQRDERFE